MSLSSRPVASPQRRSGGVDMRASRQDIFDNPETRLRYEAYSRLQGAAVAFGENLPIPEIVAIGGQSDGKSSLLEAFLGFRFNVREVEMGTRRPLIVQMIHDPTAAEPRCRLQDEDSDEYGPPIVPETSVADAIAKRTEEHLRKLGGVAVSSKPIIMRAEYAFCPNLTIVDTPGFILKARNGEADRTPEDIMEMVKAQAAPAHRLILFLQQSSVEWASSLWLHVVQQVDPSLQRTVIVASKFDNRLKEFGERWEVDKYLSATGYLPSNARPFFVALPKDRTAQSSGEWRKQLGEVDSAIFKHLREQVKGGFDEDRFASRVGFSNLKRFLEDELARRYRDAAPATLAVLQERCEAAASDLMAAETRLRSAEDVGALRKAGMTHASSMSNQVQQLLVGSTEPDPAQHGSTTDEERAASRIPQWPEVSQVVRPPNAGLRLFGGAAFERCLNEFQEAAHLLKFPSAVARDKVANVLLAYKGKNNMGGAARAAEDIARQTAKELLGPLLDTACSRLAFVLRRVFDISADRAAITAGSKDMLQPYVAFHAALRSAHMNFLNKLEEQARTLVRHHLDAATSEFAVNLLASLPDNVLDEEGGSGEVTELEGDGGGDARNGRNYPPHGLLRVAETPSPSLAGQLGQGGVVGMKPFVDNTPSKGRAPKTQRMEGNAPSATLLEGRGTYEDVIKYAERLFCRIRYSVTQCSAPATLKSAFLDPIRERLALAVSLELFARSDVEYMTMFTAAGAMSALAAKRDALQRRVEGLIKCKTEFQELAKCL